MEAFFGLFALGILVVMVAAPVLALVALARVGRLGRELDETRRAVAKLERLMAGDADSRAAAAPARPAAARALPVVAPETPTAAGEPRPLRPEAAPPPQPPLADLPAPAAAPAGRPVPPEPLPSPPTGRPTIPLKPAARNMSGESAARGSRAAAPSSSDFATNLGPRLLVAAGGLAVVVFLGFFVRYAWENDWVGPTGRVLTGAVFSLGLAAAGLRLIDREYRPLGQGLTAAGLSGLYVTAFAAHSVYGLLAPPSTAVFMVVVTGCGVALADRLGARLLAALAWIGGYLTPVLLSTGEDRAESLILYLLLLGAGAMWLDRRQAWPETLLIALCGSTLLYAGWYVEHFRAERFAVAASGLVLLTALFALGSAPKRRPIAITIVAALAACGLAALAAGADRPTVVLALGLALAAAVLRLPGAGPLAALLLATLALAAPFLFWAGAHFRPDAFGVAAAWLVSGALLLVLLPPRQDAAPAPESGVPGAGPASSEGSVALASALAVLAGGAASIGLAAAADRPFAILALLAAQAGVAVLVERRWEWAEASGAALAAVAAWTWLGLHFDATRPDEGLVLGSAIAGAYFLAVTLRGFAAREELAAPGAATHVIAAALAWSMLYRVLDATAPAWLGPTAVVLGALHLVVGLAARSNQDLLRMRVTLGLAAGFLTIAIPVQLGLHGITLAWAAEGLVLLWLGARQASWRTRAAGYAVLALAAGRLFSRHLPLHEDPFRPLANPAFGVWLAVVLALAAGWWLASRLPQPQDNLDVGAAAVLGPAALAFAFGLLTMETRAVFAQRAREALLANDAAAGQAAALQGNFAVSVLWTLFATGLLAAGLGLRSRGLFYAAYGLFAVTAGKLVLVDLATLPTLYRMLSFLALGVLLLAGAWLNLLVRERLALPAGAQP